MRKYIPYIVILVFCIITFILLIIPTKPKDVKILYYKKNYNLSSSISNNDYLNIDLMINDYRSYMIDKSQILHSYLTDKALSSIIDLELIDIIQSDNTIDYENDVFYNYTFVFKVLFKTDSFTTWYIKDAILKIGYNGNKNYSIDIGNFSLIKLEKNNDDFITISSVKPLLSKINKNQYLTGLVLGIRSNCVNDLYLKNINILNEGVFVGNNISMINDEPDSNDFKEVLGYDFLNQQKGNGEINYLITDKIQYFVIPIYYDNLIMVNTFPIEFTIKNNNSYHKFYFNNFKYFEQLDIVINRDDIDVYEVL